MYCQYCKKSCKKMSQKEEAERFESECLEEEIQKLRLDEMYEKDFLRWITLFMYTELPVKEMASRNIKIDDLKIPHYRLIYKKILDHNKNVNIFHEIAKIDGILTYNFILDMLTVKINITDPITHLTYAIKKILDRNWNEKRDEIRNKIRSGLHSDEETLSLVHEFEQLSAHKKDILC